MGFTKFDALRVSPMFTSDDWRTLNQENSDDWSRATEIVKDRLDGRFLRYASNCLRSPHSGFVVLAIDSLVLETLQQFRDGVTDGKNNSRALIKKFLQGKRFQPYFDKAARNAYYSDIRCGLLHQAEARKKWLIRRDQPTLLRQFPHGDGYIIDVRRFHKCVRQSLNDYLAEINNPVGNAVRQNLWIKMEHICSVREQRGALDAEDVVLS